MIGLPPTCRRVLRLAAVGFAACNGYHLLTCAARLTGVYGALRDMSSVDMDSLDALFAEYDTNTAS